jgi:hypothetical protein
MVKVTVKGVYSITEKTFSSMEHAVSWLIKTGIMSKNSKIAPPSVSIENCDLKGNY